jgi:hypothetical protein
MGNVNENLHIDIEYPLNWNVASSQKKFNLEPFGKKVLNMSVKPPISALSGDMGEVILEIINSNGTVDEVRRFLIFIENDNEEEPLKEIIKEVNDEHVHQNIKRSYEPLEEKEQTLKEESPVLDERGVKKRTTTKISCFGSFIGIFSLLVVVFLVFADKRRK